MLRFLIGLAIAVVVLSVGVIAVVAMKQDSPPTPTSATPAESTKDPAEVVASEAEAEPAAPVAVAARKVRPAAEPAKAVSVAPEAAPATEVASAEAKVGKILDSLSDEEMQALGAEMGRRQMRKWQDQVKYQLPSSMKLQMLQWQNRGANKLDDAQRARIKQIEEGLRPRVEAALQGYWDQQEALSQQLAAAQSGGRNEETKVLFEQIGQVHQQIAAAKGDLDKEYQGLLRGVLTPEQAEIMESNQGVVIQSWGAGPGNTRVFKSP